MSDHKLNLTDKKLCSNIVCPISLENISRISNDRITLMSDRQCYKTKDIYEWVISLYNRGLRVGQQNFGLPNRMPITELDLYKLNIPSVEYNTRSRRRNVEEKTDTEYSI